MRFELISGRIDFVPLDDSKLGRYAEFYAGFCQLCLTWINCFCSLFFIDTLFDLIVVNCFCLYFLCVYIQMFFRSCCIGKRRSVSNVLQKNWSLVIDHCFQTTSHKATSVRYETASTMTTLASYGDIPCFMYERGTLRRQAATTITSVCKTSSSSGRLSLRLCQLLLDLFTLLGCIKIHQPLNNSM